MSPENALRISAGAVMAMLGSGAALASDLVVTVDGVANARGMVLVAACTRDTFLGAGCPWRASAPARAGSVTVTFRGLAPGQYAVQAFHDENGNGDLDRGGVFGLPREAMAFSNGVRLRYGPPRFDDAAVAVEGAATRIQLRLVYPGSASRSGAAIVSATIRDGLCLATESPHAPEPLAPLTFRRARS